MCGRFAVSITKTDIEKLLPGLSSNQEIKPNFNVAPTQMVATIKDETPNEISFQKWGLIPFWAKEKSIGTRMINARGETVQKKASFRNAFKKRRCLIPATGYYEWKKVGKEKFPYYLGFDNKPFLMAGLWEKWTDKETGEIIESNTIITTEPNEFTAEVHDRMPVILNQDDAQAWINPQSTKDELQELLIPYPSDGMTAWQVSKEVNSPRNNFPELINTLDG